MKTMILFYVLIQVFMAPQVLAANFSSDAALETKKAVKTEAEEVVAVAVKETVAPATYKPVVVEPAKVIAPAKVEIAVPAKQPVPPVQKAVVVEKKIVEAPKKAAAPVETKAVQAAPAAVSTAEPEALTKFKAIQSQEVRVEKLKKQLDGEISQLTEMRKSMAESFGLDAKKLESGAYNFDPKSGKFVEK